jgi:hypothetical protein
LVATEIELEREHRHAPELLERFAALHRSDSFTKILTMMAMRMMGGHTQKPPQR